MRRFYLSCLLLLVLLAATNCYHQRASRGGGQISSVPARKINPSDIALQPGYRMEVVATRLNFPTACAFDDQGRLYVIEAGYSYGEVWSEPRLLRVEFTGTTSLQARESRLWI